LSTSGKPVAGSIQLHVAAAKTFLEIVIPASPGKPARGYWSFLQLVRQETKVIRARVFLQSCLACFFSCPFVQKDVAEMVLVALRKPYCNGE
jgi:hypothetical protein